MRDQALTQMDLALEHINRAIDALAEVAGTERIMEELNAQAIAIEDEIAELESLESLEGDQEPDHGELVEWMDFDPDC